MVFEPGGTLLNGANNPNGGYDAPDVVGEPKGEPIIGNVIVVEFDVGPGVARNSHRIVGGYVQLSLVQFRPHENNHAHYLH